MLVLVPVLGYTLAVPVRVELSNPGDDAEELAAVLRAAGFEVTRVALAELGRHGQASVVDVSQTGAEDVIDALLARGGHPVVRLGAPAHEQGALTRPIGHDALLVAVRRALAHGRAAGGAIDEVVTVTHPVGHTYQPGIELSDGPGLTLTGDEDADPRPSESLEAALLAEGGEVLLDNLSRGQLDGALELSPDVLFDFPLGPGDGPEKEHQLSALERSLPDLVEAAVPMPTDVPPAASPEADVNRREGWLGLDDATLGTPDPTGSYRTGQTAPLGMVRLLWRIAELGLDLELDASFGEQRLLLRYLAGGVRELRGESHLRLLRALDPPLDAKSEREAQALVENEMLAGRLSRFELDRGLRLAYEAQFEQLALADDVTFTLRPLSGKDGRRLAESPTPLARPALALLVGAARRRLGLKTLERLAGGAPRLRLSQDVQGRLQQAEVEPELRGVLLRHDGDPWTEIVDEVGESVGVVGLLCVLSVLDAVRFVADSAQPHG